MADDLAEVEELAGALLRRLSSPERRRLLRQMARTLRQGQIDRIAEQRDPEGRAFAPRRVRRAPTPGKFAVRFLYPTGGEPRAVFMKSWEMQGPLLTGYDIEAGGIRSFFWDKVIRWLPVEADEQNAGAGKLRRRGALRRKAMFRRLGSARHLRASATDRDLWVGFSGRAAAVAAVHQFGLSDRPAAKADPVRYAERRLLGATPADRERLLDMMFAHISPG